MHYVVGRFLGFFMEVFIFPHSYIHSSSKSAFNTFLMYPKCILPAAIFIQASLSSSWITVVPFKLILFYIVWIEVP